MSYNLNPAPTAAAYYGPKGHTEQAQRGAYC
jgi:hypothetical protein